MQLPEAYTVQIYQHPDYNSKPIRAIMSSLSTVKQQGICSIQTGVLLVGAPGRLTSVMNLLNWLISISSWSALISDVIRTAGVRTRALAFLLIHDKSKPQKCRRCTVTESHSKTTKNKLDTWKWELKSERIQSLYSSDHQNKHELHWLITTTWDPIHFEWKSIKWRFVLRELPLGLLLPWKSCLDFH